MTTNMHEGKAMDWDQMQADIEAGTKGDWEVSGDNGRVLAHFEGMGFWEIANATDTKITGESGFVYDAGGDKETNARRIARVRRLEALALAGRDLAKELKTLHDAEFSGSLRRALAAWEAAEKEAGQ